VVGGARERHARGGERHHPEERGAGRRVAELPTVLDRDDREDRPGDDRQRRDRAGHDRSPAPPGERRQRDEQRRERDLQGEDAQGREPGSNATCMPRSWSLVRREGLTPGASV
jgi:hypothetical protein